MKLHHLVLTILILAPRGFAADSGKFPAPAKVEKPGKEADLANLTLTAEAETGKDVFNTSEVKPALAGRYIGKILSANSECLWSQFSEGRDACFGTRPFVQPSNDTYSIDTNRCKDLLERSLCNTDIAALTHTE